MGTKTIQRIRKASGEEGLARAIESKQRTQLWLPKLDGEKEARRLSERFEVYLHTQTRELAEHRRMRIAGVVIAELPLRCLDRRIESRELLQQEASA